MSFFSTDPADSKSRTARRSASRGVWGANALRPQSAPDDGEPADADPLMAFDSESGERSSRRARRTSSRRPVAIYAVIGLVAIAAAAALFLRWRTPATQAAAVPTGTVLVTSTPPGATVTIDGQPRGATPAAVSVPAGAHTLVVSAGHEQRTIPLDVKAGAEIAHFLEFAAATTATDSASLNVVTEPAGANVSIDGRPVGRAPITVTGLTAAEHKIVINTDGTTVSRTVSAAAGTTTSVVFSLGKNTSLPVGGWVTVTSPFDVQLSEAGTVVGAAGAKVMLTAGRHTLDVDNAALGFHDRRSVDVIAGQTTGIIVDPPQMMVSVNAQPWADVIIDGVAAGQTPLANVPLTVGPHEIVFRNPQRPEKRQSVVVTARGPNRFSADLTR